MDVTIIGTGNMARGIDIRVIAGGHDLTVVGKEAERKRSSPTSAARTRRASPTPAIGSRATWSCSRGHLQTRARSSRSTAIQLAGKVVVDITNPVNAKTFDDLVVPHPIRRPPPSSQPSRPPTPASSRPSTPLRDHAARGGSLGQAGRPDRRRRRAGQGLGDRRAGARRRPQPDRRRPAEARTRARGARPAPHGRPGHARLASRAR